MELRLVSIDPGTDGEHCPTVFLDEDTGDLILQGWIVMRGEVVAAVSTQRPLAPSESLVRLPHRLRSAVLRGVDGMERHVRERSDIPHKGPSVPEDPVRVVDTGHLDDEFVFRGQTLTDQEGLAQAEALSHMGNDELIIRIEAHYAQMIREALTHGRDSSVP